MIINKPIDSLYYIINISAIIIGIFYIIISLKKEKISNKQIFTFMVLFLLVSLFCGKLYSVIIAKGKISLLNAGLSSYGGLSGAILFTYIFEKKNKLENVFMKYTILSLPLIYSLSKYSCFIQGCCHGIPYKGPFAIQYTNIGTETFFPIQLIEIITFMFLFLLCNRHKFKKNIEYITLISISILKFLLDYLRYAHIGKVITHNQIFSILLLLITLLLLLIKKKKRTA